MKTKAKKLLSLLLVLVLLCGMFPAAFADSGGDDAVTVYMTVSKKSQFVEAEATTEPMALVPVTVPYFDLALYGLEALYYNPDCYAVTGSGQVGGTKEMAEGKVTLLHLIIFATEVFQCGLDPVDAGKGQLAKDGWPWFEVNSVAPGSAYISFWNFGSDVTYYLNYQYPLGQVGWGSTCDQILLSDGDVVSLRYDTGTSGNGSYFHFGEKGLITKEITQGSDLKLTLYETTKTADYSGTGHEPVGAGRVVTVVEEIGGEVLATATTGENGDVTLDTTGLAKGRYYVVSDTYDPAVMLLLVDEHEYLPERIAPTCTKDGYTLYTCACGKSYKDDKTTALGHDYEDGTCLVCGQSENVALYGDANGDGGVMVNDAVVLAQYLAQYEVSVDEAASDVDGNGSITINDLVLVRQYLAKLIEQFPAEK